MLDNNNALFKKESENFSLSKGSIITALSHLVCVGVPLRKGNQSTNWGRGGNNYPSYS